MFPEREPEGNRCSFACLSARACVCRSIHAVVGYRTIMSDLSSKRARKHECQEIAAQHAFFHVFQHESTRVRGVRPTRGETAGASDIVG